MGSGTKHRAGTFALVACLIGIVVGARWAVVDRYGSDLPNWDQWDAEGLHLLEPWFAHRLTLAELVRPNMTLITQPLTKPTRPRAHRPRRRSRMPRWRVVEK